MRKTFAVSILGWFLVVGSAASQPVAKKSDVGAYAIPYASESNRIELDVLNSTNGSLKDVSVQLDAGPVWLTFQEAATDVGVLRPGESKTATFTFDLDEKAPVGEITDLSFDVLSATGHLESKTIKIEPEAPTDLMLRGNYPNPFNPTTKIAYALPMDGSVRIAVFNSIGRRVARITDAIQQAGYHEATWNAATFPSGVYFYSVELKAETKRRVKMGKMVVVK